MTQPGARAPMTPDDAARARAEELAHELVNEFWSVDYDDNLVKRIARVMLTFAAQAAQRENEACYEIARAFIAPIGSQVDTRVIWTTNAAQDIAAKIKARCHPTPDRKE